MATTAQIDTVTRHFLIAALWADSAEGTSPRAPSATQETARGLCSAFIDKYPALFEAAIRRHAHGYGMHPDAGSGEAAFGHDLYLTAAGHGVGFWDRKELGPIEDGEGLDAVNLGELLTEAVRVTFGYSIECQFYRGWLYLSGEVKK